MKGEVMEKVRRQKQWAQAFTLVELMIVVTIVAILALIAIPLYSANTTASIMSEGVAGVGTIRSALRVYYSQNNTYANASLPTSTVPGTLQVAWGDLAGKYFAQGDYKLGALGVSTYTITAGPPTLTTKAQLNYIINQDGTESGTYTSGQ
jgi:prepilin-type N-terminal cleavage/methylation domain-containing protein